jgi:hypothetical protein
VEGGAEWRLYFSSTLLILLLPKETILAGATRLYLALELNQEEAEHSFANLAAEKRVHRHPPHPGYRVIVAPPFDTHLFMTACASLLQPPSHYDCALPTHSHNPPPSDRQVLQAFTVGGMPAADFIMRCWYGMQTKQEQRQTVSGQVKGWAEEGNDQYRPPMLRGHRTADRTIGHRTWMANSAAGPHYIPPSYIYANMSALHHRTAIDCLFPASNWSEVDEQQA